MKVLVTGGAGFIGSNVSDHYIQQGHEVKVIDNLATGTKDNIKHLMANPNFEFTFGTVTDKSVMEPMVQWADIIYHLAAPVGVKYIMQNPVVTILDNIRGIDVMLELANKYRKRILVASTSEVYGRSLDKLDPTGKAKLKEDDYRVEGSTTNHRWAYANTKSMDEFLALAYYKEFKTEVVIVRFFNTVGPRQLSSFGMVIPNFVKSALKNEDIKVFGTGLQQRSFMHVNDVVRAITQLMANDQSVGQVFNVGNPFEITINELAERIIAKAGSTSKLRHISYEEAYGPGFEDMDRRTADITKLKNFLNFEIQYTIDDILEDVIAHHRHLQSA